MYCLITMSMFLSVYRSIYPLVSYSSPRFTDSLFLNIPACYVFFASLKFILKALSWIFLDTFREAKILMCSTFTFSVKVEQIMLCLLVAGILPVIRRRSENGRGKDTAGERKRFQLWSQVAGVGIWALALSFGAGSGNPLNTSEPRVFFCKKKEKVHILSSWFR